MVAMGAYHQALHRSLVLAATVFFIAGAYLFSTRLFNDSPTAVTRIKITTTTTTNGGDNNNNNNNNPPPGGKLTTLDGMLEPGAADLPMSYGQYARPGFDGLTLTGALPADVVPTPSNGRRLLIIGDIHGMDVELDELLAKARFDPARDHVVAAGDMVNKGPSSPAVVARLMALGASAVRGNHDDRVLLAHAERAQLKGVSAKELAAANDDEDAAVAHRGEAEFVAVARALSPDQIAWLARQPVILTADPLPIYVVHAGLVPGLGLDKQDPWAVMHMRSLRYPLEELRREERKAAGHDAPSPKKKDDGGGEDEDNPDSDSDGTDADADDTYRSVAIPIEDHSGRKWTSAWNQQQKRLPRHQRRTVIYGHDAKRGFVQGKHTIGLDSACVYGGALTALIIEGSDKPADAGWKHTMVQVVCRQGMRNNS
ncbi:Bis(5'-nucleosyl)-tetraphosphatase (symmetrical) [Purpureocillium takamizusanense]|uniref:Bis(5'-nucleosyl)-tetraphosphatase (Symmetrical) n=1 Tax=Purpureocillium takamizusanense TaxID=2060973 RepID=A0A9Q8VG06_9HYPO|nr:Bis(5'-nucleosyl)-tetraphosphatase (symmetrical) [Purpureocillium takamizusanense]UNI24021.1 Bis(5'-nucleosyl)-tetraphosphatase (symmetrical) [Purpureocillium takamizusanense]